MKTPTEISMKKVRNYINHSLDIMAKRPEIRRATVYVTPNITVKVTRQKRARANAKQRTFLLSVGSPNFLERRYLKAGKVTKYPLPVYEDFA